MKLTLRLPDALYDELELLTPEGMKVETFLEKRLPLLAKVNPDRPYMHLNGDNLSAISALFGGTVFKTPDDLITTMKRTQSFRLLGTIDVTLDTDLLSQMQMQADGMGIPFEKYLKDNLNEALMFLVGVPIQHITVPGNHL